MSEKPHPYEEGKRAGIHPLIVIFAVLIGLWLFVFLIVPSSKNKQAAGTEGPTGPTIEDPEAAPVLFKVQSTILDMNAISLTVPPEATDSQVVGLLPATTPGHKLGNHAVADIYIVSDAKYAQPDVIRILTRGAHAPGNLYPQAVPFETAMEAIRGHYRIDLNDTGNPDSASLGFADESGVHSRQYRKIF